MITGRGGVFDVHLDGELIYSKHQTGEFPDENKLVVKLDRRLAKKS